MKVVPFVTRRSRAVQGDWMASEIGPVIDACTASRGDLGGWDIGMTEAGDPQLYLLGPAPQHDCMLCVSRVGGRYVLEDGQGRVLFEHDAILPVAERVKSALARRRPATVARLVAAWLAVKTTFEERVEPIVAEPIEMFTHVGPQLASLI